MATMIVAERLVDAPAAVIFELIADPSQQPRWDGNDNLAEAPAAQRVTKVGDVFVMHNTSGKTKENHVTVFDEGRAIAWKTADAGTTPPGHQWGWELEESDDGTLVRHTYDFSALTDPQRLERARRMSPTNLMASIQRLAALAEGEARR